MSTLQKKWLKIGSFIFGGLVLIYFLGTLALNHWLKNNLPTLINHQLPYHITYQEMDIGLSARSITLKGINISKKQEKIASGPIISGSIEVLKIKQISVWDALKNKVIHAGKVAFTRPNLTLILPEENKNHNTAAIFFNQIKIIAGNIHILKPDKDSLLSIEKLNLELSDFKLTEKNVKQKLPILFNQYKISGENFMFKINEAYLIKARKISGENHQTALLDFRLVPLLSRNEFHQKFPKKSFLFAVDCPFVGFKNIQFENNTLSLSEIALNHPSVQVSKIKTQNQTKEQKEGGFNFNVALKNIKLAQGSFLITAPDGSPFLKAGQVDAELNEININEDTERRHVPFDYKSYHFIAKNIAFTPAAYQVKVASLQITDQNMSILNASYHTKDGRNRVNIPKINLHNYRYNFQFGAGQLHADSLQLTHVKAELQTSLFNKKSSKSNASSRHFPLNMQLKHFALDGEISLIKPNGKTLIKLNELQSQIENLKVNENTLQNPIPFEYEHLNLKTTHLSWQPNAYSQMSIGAVTATENEIRIDNFALTPSMSRAQFIASLKKQKDLYTLKIPKVKIADYHLSKYKDKMRIQVSDIQIIKPYFNIYSYRGKKVAEDLRPRTFFNQKLRNISMPLRINKTSVTDGTIIYEETNDEAEAPGKLSFTHLNASLSNINSAKIKETNTRIDIEAQTNFMGSAPTHVSWTLEVADPSDAFQFTARINNLEMNNLNAFIKPYLHVAGNGVISSIAFNFTGNKRFIQGPFTMDYHDLHIELLDKTTHKRKKLLSKVANLALRSNPKTEQNTLLVNHPRTEQKSFFNLLLKGLLEGTKKSLVGTVPLGVSDAVKDLKEVMGDDKGKKPSKPKTEDSKKEGFFQRIFKKSK